MIAVLKRWLVLCIVVATIVHGREIDAAGPYEASEPIAHTLRTEHGTIYIESVHPLRNGKVVRAPAILTYSPYSALGRNGDAERWVSRGYSRIWADVVGTANSGGCWDYGGERERATGYDVVEWVAKQRWSTGAVAMVGGGYEGATALATATRRPPHLATVVVESAVTSWYDYAYLGGIRALLNNEALSHQGPAAAADAGFHVPAAFDLGLAIPPPLDVDEPSWSDRVQSTIQPCEEIEHTQRGYDDTPDYDAFWRERDYVADAGRITIPVLIGASWGDWNIKQAQSWDLFHALRRLPKKVLFMGGRWSRHSRPAGLYSKIADDWLEQYVRGVRKGVERLPSVFTQSSDAGGDLPISAGRPKTKDVVLYAQPAPPTGGYLWQLLPIRPRDIGGAAGSMVAAFTSASINTESHALHHARLNHDWFWFEAPPFRRDVRVFGEIRVQVWLDVDREWVTLTPTVADVDMSDHVVVGSQHVGATDPAALVGLTRGWLDSRYREGRTKQTPLPSSGSFGMTVEASPVDYIFRAGHIVGLNVQTEINEWSLPKPYACASAACPQIEIDWSRARTRLILPVVDAPANPATLFDFGHQH